MVRFPSDEWIKTFKEELNKSKNYEEVAKTWEGDFLFVVTPDEELKEEVISVLNQDVYELVINSLESGIERAWSNYNYSSEDKFFNENYATFRLNCTINLNDRCFNGNSFNIEQC